MVTVVDAANFLKDYASGDFLRDRGESLGEEDERTLVDLLVEQIEFANVVVLNKISMVSKEECALARKVIRSLNPDARIEETDFGQVPLNTILDTRLFDFNKAHEHPLWYKELYGFNQHVPETEEYGVRSFVYRARKPFDPARFQAFIDQNWPGVVRSKGFFWLATRPDFVGEISQAGALVRTSKRGRWWSAVPKHYWPAEPEWQRAMQPYFHEVWGDRRQEIVLSASIRCGRKRLSQNLINVWCRRNASHQSAGQA